MIDPHFPVEGHGNWCWRVPLIGGGAILFLAPIAWVNVATILIVIASLLLIYRWGLTENHPIEFTFSNPGVICLGLWLCSIGLAIVFSNHPIQGLRTSSALIVGLPLFFAFSLMTLEELLGGLKWLLGIVLLSLIQLFYLRFLHLTLHPAEVIRETQLIFYVVPNDLSLLVILALLVTPLILTARHQFWYATAIFSLLIGVLVIYQVGITLIALGILATWLALMRGQYRLLLWGLGGMVGLFLGIDGTLGWPLTDKFFKFATQLDARIELWVAAWQMFLDRPLTGIGLHTFGTYYLSYLQQVDIPPWIATDDRHTPWAHNLFLEILGEQGIIGLILWLLILITLFSTIYRVVSELKGQLYALGQGLLLGLFVFCFTGLLELSFKRLWATLVVFLFFGIITAINPIFKAYQED